MARKNIKQLQTVDQVSTIIYLNEVLFLILRRSQFFGGQVKIRDQLSSRKSGDLKNFRPLHIEVIYCV